MKKVIWKYRLCPKGGDIVHTNTVYTDTLVPEGAVPIHVGAQEDDIFVWVVADPDSPSRKSMELVAVATGESFEAADVGRFLGTVLMYQGTYVFHFFERAGSATVHP